MGDGLHTSTHKTEQYKNLSASIKHAILELKNAFPNQDISALKWNENFVAIPLEVEINLPSRGPVNNTDIRKIEPIFLLLHRVQYPFYAPTAWSNRMDFPVSRLPHLNPTFTGAPANFCLHRGKISDWYAEHTIVDFVHRIRHWLRDAARDRLIRHDDGFEVTRIENKLGYTIYESENLCKLVFKSWQDNCDKGDFKFTLHTLINNPSSDPLIQESTYAIRYEFELDDNSIEEVRELCNKINSMHYDKQEVNIDRRLFGILVFPNKDVVTETYCSNLPSNLRELKDWANSMKLPISECLEKYVEKGLHLFKGIPITTVIHRPQNLIDSEFDIELLNFVIHTPNETILEDKSIDEAARVFVLGHREPLTLKRARFISSFPQESDFGKLLFIGCGAIGSKMILHFARSGLGRMTLIDDANLSPHNLVRHGLLSNSVGKNKAEAVHDSVKEIFYRQKDVKIDVINESILSLLSSHNKIELKDHSWIIDATASPMVLNFLITSSLPSSLNCCRCEIADGGRLGFLSIEGDKRNPRFDDLQMLLFDKAIDEDYISAWLQSISDEREDSNGSVLEEIQIGISCSSETMRLADEIVSIHAAAFTSGLRSYINDLKRTKSGKIQINNFLYDDHISYSINHYDIEPLMILNAKINPIWQVRLSHNAVITMLDELNSDEPDETGGILIGQVNYKRKIIYITRVLASPEDSKKSPYAFERGIHDIPEQVEKIQDRTGGMLGYVGEWHTHPTGGAGLSKIDGETVNKIRKNLDKVPIPTLIMIVTKREFCPYVFSSQ